MNGQRPSWRSGSRLFDITMNLVGYFKATKSLATAKAKVIENRSTRTLNIVENLLLQPIPMPKVAIIHTVAERFATGRNPNTP